MQVVPFDVHFNYIDNAFICIADKNELGEAKDWLTNKQSKKSITRPS